MAEQITTRFFNVLRLLNRAVPMIAVQISAFRTGDGEISLHAVTVLNVIEETEDEADVDPAERADRPTWEKKSPDLLIIVDRIASLVRDLGDEPRLTYNRGHIALATTGYNFCWFYPRKSAGYITIRVRSDTRDENVAQLQAAGFDPSLVRSDRIGFTTSAKVLDAPASALVETLKAAQEWGNRLAAALNSALRHQEGGHSSETYNPDKLDLHARRSGALLSLCPLRARN